MAPSATPSPGSPGTTGPRQTIRRPEGKRRYFADNAVRSKGQIMREKVADAKYRSPKHLRLPGRCLTFAFPQSHSGSFRGQRPKPNRGTVLWGTVPAFAARRQWFDPCCDFAFEKRPSRGNPCIGRSLPHLAALCSHLERIPVTVHLGLAPSAGKGTGPCSPPIFRLTHSGRMGILPSIPIGQRSRWALAAG